MNVVVHNYIPEKRKFSSGILCFRQRRRVVHRRRRRVPILSAR